MQPEAGRRVALVTGGARGIGRAAAWCLADAGFDVIVADLRGDTDAGETVDGLRSRGAQAEFIAADIADLADHGRLVTAAWAASGRLDCLVNNAGVQTLARGDLLEVTPASFDRVVGVNLRGTFFLSQAVARRMLDDEPTEAWRSIIFVTSTNAAIAAPTRGDYCMSKAGLSMANQLFALRLAPHRIASFEIQPSTVRTGMTADVLAQREHRLHDGSVPMARWGEPDDIGRAVALLAAGGLTYATGTTIPIDGGSTLRPN
jgi:NAD(P)-dependent dehydrogenase (short-subunit alcohol dehydrogenase family)